MAFKVEPVCPADLAEFVSVLFRAHRGESHWLNCGYPDNFTSEGQKKALEKLQRLTATFEHSKWEKVIDTTTGEIVGGAIWAIYETRKRIRTLPSVQKDISEREEYVRALGSSAARTEESFWSDNDSPLASLTSLTVLPEHQHKGIGGLLMKSGLEHIDNIGAKVSVLAFDASKRLYEKCEFKVERHVTLEVPEKFSAEVKTRIFFMV